MEILLDIDGVIADFVGASLALINKRMGSKYQPHHVTQWEIPAALNLAPDVAEMFEIEIRAKGFCESIQA
jgi:hypothetical protein